MLGPIITLQAGATLTLDNIEVSGGKGTGMPPGQGVNCGNSGTVTVRDSLIQNNASDGIVGNQCGVTALRSQFTNNQRGIALMNGTASIDRSVIESNRGRGLDLATGLYTITNSFIARNIGGVFTDIATIQYCTIADNGGSADPGITCGATANVGNSIIVRNTPANVSATCTPTNSIVATDVSAIQFKSPDAPPYDYHLMPNSSAVDHGTGQDDHDIDGDQRPMGSAADLGADEVR